MRLIFIIAIICSGVQISSAQFQSDFHTQYLIYSDNPAPDRFYRPNAKRGSKLTFVLPSLSATLVSPHLTYGDIYKAETKTLDLVAASQSEKDFALEVNARASYGGLLYKIKNFRFSLFHEALLDSKLNVPNQIFELATEGNNKFRDSSVDVNPLVFFQSTHKWALGIDYYFEKLMVGAQFNLYTGNAYLNTHNSSVTINFEENFFEFGFDKSIDVKSSGAIDYQDINDVGVILGDNAISATGSFSNLGFGLSAQMRYQVSESLKIYGRIEDLGFIKWSLNTQTLTDDSYSQFGGLDIRESYVTGEPYSVTDTLYSKIDIDKQTDSFTSHLLYSFFVGAGYKLNDYVSIGGIVRTRDNGTAQRLFVEPHVTLSPLSDFNLSIGNVFNSNTLFNPKVVLNAEVRNRFGVNLVLVNPWKFGRYYDAEFLHASLSLYVNLFGVRR